VHLARVRAINVAEKWIASERVRLRFEYLVLACGARHGYFGHGEWEQHAPGLKTLEQAVEMRRRLLQAFEMAENELGPATLRVLLTFVVVGGGPTGVELAGAIADISRTVLLRDFRRIDPSCSSVVLLEAGPRIVAAFPPTLSSRAEHDLAQLGVEVRTGATVTSIDAGGVEAGGERIAARKVFWAAGVQLASVAKSVGVASIALAGSMSWPTCRFPALPTSSPPATSCISTSRAERSCRASPRPPSNPAGRRHETPWRPYTGSRGRDCMSSARKRTAPTVPASWLLDDSVRQGYR
jgi:NADH dehydrogenase FAD-containing subunit